MKISKITTLKIENWMVFSKKEQKPKNLHGWWQSAVIITIKHKAGSLLNAHIRLIADGKTAKKAKAKVVQKLRTLLFNLKHGNCNITERQYTYINKKHTSWFYIVLPDTESGAISFSGTGKTDARARSGMNCQYTNFQKEILDFEIPKEYRR